MGASSDGGETLAARLLGAVFPLAQALRENRALRLRRPEMAAPTPRFRDTDVAHWQAALESSPSLGAVIDQVYEHEAGHCAAVAAKAQRALATSAVVISILALTVMLPAIGQMFAVSPWLLVAALYAFAALFGAVRAVQLARFLHVELDALAEPLEEARNARGETASGVLLLHVRARRAAAVLHNRIVAQAASNLADATFASLRNAFVAVLLWMALEVAPATFAY
ncbi:MAG TPA: hypothetical protein VIS07_16130 [Candidatus Binatia bacterium]